MNPTSGSLANGSPRGMTAIGIFLLFGAVMAFLAGATLLWPGTSLDRMWILNPRAYSQLVPFGKSVGIPFLLLSVALAAAAVGWFNHRLWGWRLAVAIIAMQVLGDLVNVFLGHIIEGGIGVAIAGALFLYLLRPKVKAVFEGGACCPSERPQCPISASSTHGKGTEFRHQPHDCVRAADCKRFRQDLLEWHSREE